MAAIGSLDSSGSLRIEVEGDSSSGDYGSLLSQSVQALAGIVAGIVSAMPEESRPKDLTLACGLKALPAGGFAVSLGTEGANFTVSMGWQSDSEAGALGGMMPAPDQGPRV